MSKTKKGKSTKASKILSNVKNNPGLRKELIKEPVEFLKSRNITFPAETDLDLLYQVAALIKYTKDIEDIRKKWIIDLGLDELIPPSPGVVP